MKFLRALLDIVLPPACVFCGLDADGLCRGCLADLPLNRHPCVACARPMVTGDALCADCQRRRPPFHTVVAPFVYAFPLDAALKALKFRARFDAVPPLAALLADACEALPDDVDGVVPMPMHWRRRALRGFNQAEELAAPIARRLGLPRVGGVERRRHTAYQSGLEAGARRRNVAKAFRAGARIAARHVLIVDDVMTTGHSAAALAHELRRAGATRVSVAVVARA